MRLATIGRGLRRATAIAGSVIPPLTRDLVGLGGACMVVYGIWQIHQPAAWIAAGLMVLFAVWRISGSQLPSQDETE